MGLRASAGWAVMAALAACSSQSASDAGTDASSGSDVASGGDGGACGAAACGLDAGCGTITDPCGNPVDCGPCAPTSESVDPAGIDPRLSVRSGVAVSYVTDDDAGFSIRVAARDGGTWTSELATPFPSPSVAHNFAVGPDGTRWVVGFNNHVPTLYWALPGAAWSFEAVNAGAQSLAIAVADDGSVYLLIQGVAPEPDGGSDVGVVLMHRVNGVWSAQAVGTAMQIGTVDLQTFQGEPRLAWTDADTSLALYAQPSAGGFAIERVTTAHPGSAISLALDATGQPRIALGDVPIHYATRVAANNWTIVDVPHGPVPTPVALSIRADGVAALAYIGSDNAIKVGTLTGATWATQTIGQNCPALFGAAFDSDGALEVVHDCGGGVLLSTLH